MRFLRLRDIPGIKGGNNFQDIWGTILAATEMTRPRRYSGAAVKGHRPREKREILGAQ